MDTGKPLPLAQSDALIFDPKGGVARLREIMARLRDPETGCAWDIEQTFASIAPYTIEEAYEVADAIEREAWDELVGELGDVLLQVIYCTQMGAEEGRFDFDTVANHASQKMVDRHPHVFGDESGDKTAEQQTEDWEKLKSAERSQRNEVRVLDGVTRGLPALMRAQKIQKRVARVGFDWPSQAEVLEKVAEELDELARCDTPAQAHEEFGDLLFAIVNVARHMDIDPEAALRDANHKFIRRFNSVEDLLNQTGKTPNDATLEEMETLWQCVKKEEPPT